MKKLILFTGTILATTVGLAQSTIYHADGILSANRTVNMNGRNLTFKPSATSSEFFINGTNGFVGVGKTTPTSMLDVNGQLTAVGGSFPKSIANGTVYANTNEEYKAANVLSAGTIVNPLENSKTFNFFDFQSTPARPYNFIWFSLQNRNDMARLVYHATQDGIGQFLLYDKNQGQVFSIAENNDEVKMILNKENSFLGIGTTSFNDGSDIYRLSVKGAIRAERVKVYTTWADYVFEKGYKLPTLEQVEKHIAEKGHLQDIPSAKQVENNGIELGEMNKLLLQKVEELTLYIIEINKKVKVLETQIKN